MNFIKRSALLLLCIVASGLPALAQKESRDLAAPTSVVAILLPAGEKVVLNYCDDFGSLRTLVFSNEGRKDSCFRRAFSHRQPVHLVRAKSKFAIADNKTPESGGNYLLLPGDSLQLRYSKQQLNVVYGTPPLDEVFWISASGDAAFRTLEGQPKRNGNSSAQELSGQFLQLVRDTTVKSLAILRDWKARGVISPERCIVLQRFARLNALHAITAYAKLFPDFPSQAVAMLQDMDTWSGINSPMTQEVAAYILAARAGSFDCMKLATALRSLTQQQQDAAPFRTFLCGQAAEPMPARANTARRARP